MYQNKYLKYKNKYLTLKNNVQLLIQRGGSIEFNKLKDSCLEQISKSDNNCPSCKFLHINNLMGTHTHTIKNCAPQDLQVYFYKEDEDDTQIISSFLNKDNGKISDFTYFDLEIEFDSDINKESFLIPEQYNNVSSYTVLSNTITITKYPTDVSTFCAEGNIVWVSKNSRVGTTGITSCLFVLIILNDDSKLCIHHTIGDEDEDGLDSGNGFQKNYTHKSYLPEILKQVSGKVKKLFYLGDGDYEKIKNIYKDILKNDAFYKLNGDGHYIIDHNNNLLTLKNF